MHQEICYNNMSKSSERPGFYEQFYTKLTAERAPRLLNTDVADILRNYSKIPDYELFGHICRAVRLPLLNLGFFRPLI